MRSIRLDPARSTHATYSPSLEPKVAQDQLLGDPRQCGDAGEGGAGESVPAEFAGRGIEDLLLTLRTRNTLGAGCTGFRHDSIVPLQALWAER